VLLRVDIQNIVVEDDFVSSEVGKHSLIDLENQYFKVLSITFDLLVSRADLPGKLSYSVDFSILCSKKGLQGTLALVKLLQLFLIAVLLLCIREFFRVKLLLDFYCLHDGLDVKLLIANPEFKSLVGTDQGFGDSIELLFQMRFERVLEDLASF
jgi:hypothetical protein